MSFEEAMLPFYNDRTTGNHNLESFVTIVYEEVLVWKSLNNNCFALQWRKKHPRWTHRHDFFMFIILDLAILEILEKWTCFRSSNDYSVAIDDFHFLDMRGSGNVRIWPVLWRQWWRIVTMRLVLLGRSRELWMCRSQFDLVALSKYTFFNLRLDGASVYTVGLACLGAMMHI